MPLAINGVANPPPYAPALLGPANASYQDLAATPTFDWQYSAATPGNTQVSWALRRKVAGSTAYQWWNLATAAWQSTEVFNSGSAQSYQFPASAWTDGYTYNWSMATTDQSGIGAYSADFTVTAQQGPTVTVAAPSGLIATGQPAVSWTTAFPNTAQQTSYRVVIYDSTQYSGAGFSPGTTPGLYDTGVVASSFTTSIALSGSGTYLADNASFRAYVQVTETGGQASAWAYSAFSTSFTQPAAPTLSANVAADSGTGAPVVELVVTGQDSSASGFPGNTVAEVQYSNDGGATWHDVRGGTGLALPSGTQQATLRDYEATPGVARQYRAYVQDPNLGVESLASSTATVTTAVDSWWLIPVLSPSLAVAPFVTTFSMTQMEQAASHLQLGQPYPVIVASAMGGKDGTVTVQTVTAAEWGALEALINAQAVCWLINPFGDGLYVRIGPAPGGMSGSGMGVTSKQSNMLPSTASSPVRQITLSYQEVAKP